jgi:hypothetical protein
VVSFLAKFNSSGVLQWQKTFDLAGHYKSGESVVCDHVGNVYATVNDYDTGYIYLVKLDTTGTVLWQNELQTNGPDIGNMSVDSNNNVLLVIDDSGNRLTFKFDPSGTLLWQVETVGGYGYGVEVDGSDNIYVGESPITKYDSSGTVLWQGYGSGQKYNTTCDPSGNVYIGGSIPGGGICGVQKLDSAGNAVWQCAINGTGLQRAYGIAYDAGNDAVVVTGQYTNGSNSDLYVASLDATTGNLNWINGFGSADYEGQWYSYGTDFINVSGSVLAITGYSYAGALANFNVITLQVPTSGQGLGTYGDFTYYAIASPTVTVTTGTVTPDSSVNQPSSIVVAAGALTVANNTYTSDLVELFPGGAFNWQFTTNGTNGSLVFPDSTVQTTALESGMNFAFGNLGAVRIGMNPVAIGTNAGQTNQGPDALAIGTSAGRVNQGQATIAIGYQAGNSSQGYGSVALGINAGQTTQGQSSIAIGTGSGQTSQGNQATAVGSGAGSNSQGQYALAIGINAGQTSQGQYSVAIGGGAGANTQGQAAVAIGSQAGQTVQGDGTVAVGSGAGQAVQGAYSIAIGTVAGTDHQGSESVAIGKQAGQAAQGVAAVALGTTAGGVGQNDYGIAVGYNAGGSNQGINAIAIGRAAGTTNQANNSIVINATGAALENTTANSVVIKPVRVVNDVTGFYQLYYDPTTGEMVYYSP